MAKYKKVGEFQVVNMVTITDPCYSWQKGNWPSRQVTGMAPGRYDCCIEDSNRPDSIVVMLGEGRIVPKIHSFFDSFCPIVAMSQIGNLPVDSGTIGFFNGRKPDFMGDEWFALCNWMQEQNEKARAAGDRDGYYIRRFDNGVTGFWSRTVYGDGCYPVYTLRMKGQIVALLIRFR